MQDCLKGAKDIVIWNPSGRSAKPLVELTDQSFNFS